MAIEKQKPLDTQSNDVETGTEELSSTVAAPDTAEPTPAELEAIEPKQPHRRFYARRFGGFSFTFNLEVALYLLIIIFAVVTRFADLDSRALHHDEGVHAYYSYQYYIGNGYNQEPWKHGPLLYHVTAATFWLLGDSVTSARIPAALLGVLIVLMPLLLRRELGRWGALTVSLLLAISPIFLYYTRFIREDIFSAVATLALVISIFKFVAKPQPRWWYFSMASLALLFCTKESSFFYAAAFGGFLFGWLCWQLAPRLLLITGGYLLVAGVIFLAATGLYPLPSVPYENPTPQAIQDFIVKLLSHPAFYAFVILAVLGIGLIIYAFREVGINRRNYLARRGLVTEDHSVAEALFMPYEAGSVAFAIGWLGRHWRTLVLGLFLAFAIYSVLYTGFFSSPAQGEAGLIGGLAYWIAQHDYARGEQPWYYYLLMLPLYEPLALMFGTFSGGYVLWKATRYGLQRKMRTELIPINRVKTLPKTDDELDAPEEEEEELSDLEAQPEWIEVEVPVSSKGNSLWPGERRRMPHPYFVPLFILFWAVASLFFYSWAGEKMPWLTMHMALPFIMLTGYLGQKIWGGLDAYLHSYKSREIIVYKFTSRGFFWWLIGSLIFIGLLGYSITLTVLPAPGTTSKVDQALLIIPFVLLVFFVISGMLLIGVRTTLFATAAVCFGLMCLFLVRTAFGFAYVRSDVPLEMGIYTQTSPDVTRVINEINLTAEVLPLRDRLPILYDTDGRTPLAFYLRHFVNAKAVTDFSKEGLATSGVPNVQDYPIIMAFTDKRDALTAQLGDKYVRRTYSFRWWFDEDQYRNFVPTAQKQIEFLTGKVSTIAVADTGGQILVTKGEVLTAEKLKALQDKKGALDKLYNSSGGNSTLLNAGLFLSGAGKELQGQDFVRLWRYVIYREVTLPIGSSDFDLYISKDIIGVYRQYSDLYERPLDRS